MSKKTELPQLSITSKLERVSNKASRRLLTCVGPQPHTSPGWGLSTACKHDGYLRLRRRELAAVVSVSSASALRMLRASRKISTQDNSST